MAPTVPPSACRCFILAAFAATLGCAAGHGAGVPAPAAVSAPLAGPAAGVVAHDPTLVHGEDGWYLFHTGRGIQASRSTDGGQTWEVAPPVLRDRPAWWDDAVPEHYSTDVWAPDAGSTGGAPGT